MTSLFRHSGFSRYLSNTSWLFADKGLRIFAGIVVGIWVARYLGPVQFGRFSFAQSFVGLFSALAALGVNSVLVRDLVHQDRDPEELLGTAFGLMAAASLITVAVVFTAVQFGDYDRSTRVLIYIVAFTMFFQAFSVVESYFHSRVLGRYPALANAITVSISSVIKITLVLAHADLVYFAVAMVLDAAILAGAYVYFLFVGSPVRVRAVRFNLRCGARLLADSWPYMLSGLLISLYMKIDQIMLKEMLGDYAVGQYSAAIRLSEAWYFVPVVIVSSLFPAIVNAKTHDNALYKRRLSKLYALMIVAGLAISLPSTFVANTLVRVLYGTEYSESGTILAVHIWACVFVFLGVAGGKWLLVENLQFYSFLNTGVGALVNVLLNLLFIPRFGAVGAAWATLAAQAFAAYFGFLLWRKTRPNFYLLSKSILAIPKLGQADF